LPHQSLKPDYGLVAAKRPKAKAKKDRSRKKERWTSILTELPSMPHYVEDGDNVGNRLPVWSCYAS